MILWYFMKMLQDNVLINVEYDVLNIIIFKLIKIWVVVLQILLNHLQNQNRNSGHHLLKHHRHQK